MLRDEITYSILELIRSGSIVDDDRLDLRLIEEFIRTKRAEFVTVMNDSTKQLPEHFFQYITSTSKTLLSPSSDAIGTYKISDMPKVVTGRSGPIITEIVEADATHQSTSINSFPYKLVNPQALKFSGNGRFNSGLIFATYRDGKLILKGPKAKIDAISRFSIKAVFETPEDVSGFDVDTMDYPVSKQCYDYIKNEVLSKDIKVFVSSVPDKSNDASAD